MNFVEDTIQKIRIAIHNGSRLEAIIKSRIKMEREQKNALLEKLVDDVAFQTGLTFEDPKEALQILTYVDIILKRAAKRKETEQEAQNDADYQAWLDGKNR
jgi:hypothetical protein